LAASALAAPRQYPRAAVDTAGRVGTTGGTATHARARAAARRAAMAHPTRRAQPLTVVPLLVLLLAHGRGGAHAARQIHDDTAAAAAHNNDDAPAGGARALLVSAKRAAANSAVWSDRMPNPGEAAEYEGAPAPPVPGFGPGTSILGFGTYLVGSSGRTTTNGLTCESPCSAQYMQKPLSFGTFDASSGGTSSVALTGWLPIGNSYPYTWCQVADTDGKCPKGSTSAN
jgi:hypothetical protein